MSDIAIVFLSTLHATHTDCPQLSLWHRPLWVGAMEWVDVPNRMAHEANVPVATELAAHMPTCPCSCSNFFNE
jgi:hypothetical protein